MSKSTAQYWNVLTAAHADKWQAVEDTDGMLEQLTLAMDSTTGDYTRLTRFKAGADTRNLGGKSHHYPEDNLHCFRSFIRRGFWYLAGSRPLRE